ncbi:hypothetical protein FRC07_003933 [Ceratobasidium sp. 392]|nr:hypothetical protein FRC07_003933 [Ceratobasidium sp. 392]
MSVSSVPPLPAEVWGTILGTLQKLSDLCSASLVSRSWQQLALPYLYHTVRLARPSHLALLAQKAATTNTSTPSFTEYLRDLTVHKDQDSLRDEEPISHADITSLTAILANASHLQRFAWELLFVEGVPAVIELLKSKCPELRSFKFVGRQDIDLFAQGVPITMRRRYTADLDGKGPNIWFFDLQNLEHYSLEIRPTVRRWDPNFEPFILPLRASPKLRSLELSFEDFWDDMAFLWNPNSVFSLLEDTTLPLLDNLSIQGSIHPDWYQSFLAPDSSALGGFFRRHSGLRTINLGWKEEFSYFASLAPEIVETLFPAVTHLDAPTFMCGPVVASKLASQLEYIGIWELSPPQIGPDLQGIAPTVKHMPKIRKMAIEGSRSGLVKMDAVKKILSCTPGLQEIQLTRRVDQPNEIVAALQLVPDLRVLKVDLTSWNGVTEKEEWDAWALSLAQTCTKLRKVTNDDRVIPRTWEFHRRSDDAIDMSCSF